MSVTDPSTAPEPVRDPVTNRRLDHRLTYGLLGLGVFVVLVVYVVWQTYPNYDTYYTLVWGKELANGHLPDYDVFRTPTPHPLSTLVAWVMAPFGTASDRILVLLSLFGLLGFYVVTFVFTERLLGRVIALLAVAVMVTRTDMQLLALRAMFDLPFYLMIFGAALLELRRPRCGWPVLLVLALAGLLRPEAWLLAGVYWLYLVADHPAPAADPLRAARGRRPGALAARRPDRHRRAALLVHLHARGVRRVRPQPRRRRRDPLDPELPRRQRPDRHGRDRRARPARRGLHPAPPGAAPARARRARAADLPDHRRRRAVGDPALPDDPVAAAQPVRRGRARRLAAHPRADGAQGGDRDRDPLRARAGLARAVLRPRLPEARATRRRSSRRSTRG